jgi:hypothetical protein
MRAGEEHISLQTTFSCMQVDEESISCVIGVQLHLSLQVVWYILPYAYTDKSCPKLRAMRVAIITIPKPQSMLL